METPNGISDYAWNLARYALSENFTKPIGDKLTEVTKLASDIDAIQAYDYVFATWTDFVADPRKPEGDLFERAAHWKGEHSDEGVYVIFDPLDDETGYLSIGVDAQSVADGGRNFIINQEPDEGPLIVDNLAMGMVEAA